MLKARRNSDKKTKGKRKLMTMHKTLYPRDDIYSLYVSRKKEKGLASIENCVDASTQGIGNQRSNRNHPDYSIVKEGENTETSPGDPRKLAVTQISVKVHLPMQV